MIAVVCAHNPRKRNLGMYSVDLSASQFFLEMKAPFSLVKFTGSRGVGSLRYEVVKRSSALKNFEKVVFWGDFQQNPIWGVRNFASRFVKENGGTKQEGIEAWKDLCLFRSNQFPSSCKLYSIGTCFLGVNEFLRSQDASLRREYTSLLSRFECIMPRDVRSLAELEELGLTNIAQGFDCATLLRQAAVRPRVAGIFAYQFARTLPSQYEKEIVKGIETHAGLCGRRVEWLLRSFNFRNRDTNFKRAVDALQEAEFVVTDIYHLTVNALRLNRDVILIGEKDEVAKSTVSDAKKQILMRMSGLQQRYVELPDRRSDIVRSVVDSCVSLMHSDGMGNVAAFATYNKLAEKFRADLRSLLFSVSEPAGRM